jgi:CRP/FNR family transcriptional regulator, cyclic AMP receptor protein
MTYAARGRVKGKRTAMKAPESQARPVEPIAPNVWTTASRSRSLLLVESQNVVGGPPPLFQMLSAREQALVLSYGQRRVVYRGKMLFVQGSPHEGIYFVETGRIRVFYTAPSGREITLAYWNPGNFVGGPDVFGPSTHLWSGAAASTRASCTSPARRCARWSLRFRTSPSG